MKEAVIELDTAPTHDTICGADAGMKKETPNTMKWPVKEGKVASPHLIDLEESTNARNSATTTNNGSTIGRSDDESTSRENTTCALAGEKLAQGGIITKKPKELAPRKLFVKALTTPPATSETTIPHS